VISKLCWRAWERVHLSKVARKNVKGHRRSALRDRSGCQDWEEHADIIDADSRTDDKLEAHRCSEIGVRPQFHQQAGADNDEDPANIYRNRVCACFLNRDARHESGEATAI